MRQIFIQVPHSQGPAAKNIIETYDPINLTYIHAEDASGPTQLLIANVSNRQIEGLFEELHTIPDTRITLVPQGVFAFRLATPHIPDQVTDIDLLSPVEVFLSGLQSIGSWKGFLGYAAAAGVLVWIRINDIRPQASRYERGRSWLFPVGIAVTLLPLGGLLLWQHSDPVKLERSSLSQRAAMDIRDVIDQESEVDLIELQTRFTRTDIPEQNSLLIVIYVQPRHESTLSAEIIQTRLRQAIQTKLREEDYEVTPLIDISVLSPP